MLIVKSIQFKHYPFITIFRSNFQLFFVYNVFLFLIAWIFFRWSISHCFEIGRSEKKLFWLQVVNFNQYQPTECFMRYSNFSLFFETFGSANHKFSKWNKWIRNYCYIWKENKKNWRRNGHNFAPRFYICTKINYY